MPAISVNITQHIQLCQSNNLVNSRIITPHVGQIEDQLFVRCQFLDALKLVQIDPRGFFQQHMLARGECLFGIIQILIDMPFDNNGIDLTV